MTLEYTHNDDVADLLYEKECQIAELEEKVAKLERRIETIRTNAFYAVESLINDGF